MNEKLIDEIPDVFKNSLPVSVCFVTGITMEPYKNKQLKFANSDFYNTRKMACYNLYKPSFLRKTYDR